MDCPPDAHSTARLRVAEPSMRVAKPAMSPRSLMLTASLLAKPGKPTRLTTAPLFGQRTARFCPSPDVPTMSPRSFNASARVAVEPGRLCSSARFPVTSPPHGPRTCAAARVARGLAEIVDSERHASGMPGQKSEGLKTDVPHGTEWTKRGAGIERPGDLPSIVEAVSDAVVDARVSENALRAGVGQDERRKRLAGVGALKADGNLFEGVDAPHDGAGAGMVEPGVLNDDVRFPGSLLRKDAQDTEG